MKLFKYINQAGGILAGLFFIVMVLLVRKGIDGRSYYVVGTLFLIFSAMFIVTACVLMFRSLMWYICKRRFGALIRHYTYAYIGFYVLLILIDHITMGNISWAHNIFYSFMGAMLELYIQGYRLEFNKQNPEPEPVAEQV